MIGEPAGSAGDAEPVQGSAGLADALEQLLLGGVRAYTREQTSELTGVDIVEARRFWRAMGFANVEDGARAFTDADLAALSRLTGMVSAGFMDQAAAVRITRAMGQAMARLAEAQVEGLLAGLPDETPGAAGGLPGEEPVSRIRAAYELAQGTLADMEQLLTYAWRRQLAAAAGRLFAAAGEETASGRLAVGFADLVGFTRLSERLEASALSELVEAFESRAADVVAVLGGRIVKTLGDEVLFVAERPDAAAEIALDLIEALRGHPTVPQLRVGVAYGDVLSQMGDVFGTTVNLASRLTSLAAPDTAVVDPVLAQALADDARYQLRAMWRRRVRGLGLVEPWQLGRAPAGVPGTPPVP